MKYFLLSSCLTLLLLFTLKDPAFAGPGDTVFVQAFQFGSAQDSIVKFPSASQSFQKILMYYTLKCNPNQSPACGEWDYLTYTYLWKRTGTFDSTVSKIDTLYNFDSTAIIGYDTSWNIYEKQERFELARYITPYGNGLSLGNGVRWIFDVSDYRSLLADSVHLSAGNWQELLDLKFVFIEGTPPRVPYKVQNVWNAHVGYGAGTENFLTAKTVSVDAAAVNTRMKVRVTGHGFGGNENCAEFCAKNHSLEVNGTNRWTQLVWRDNCARNPVYPQGGTWVYNRANWCPGAEVETYDVELTPWLTAGTDVSLDYSIDPYVWNGSGSGPYYALETQLVSYHAPNFALDAEAVNIISPTNEQIFGRLNPICGDPVVVIRNSGTTTLTSLKITYGVPDANQSTYNWTGSLGFLETDTIRLPLPDWSGVSAGNAAFRFTVSLPNGSADMYAFNNTASSNFNLPAKFESRFVIWLKTNNAGSESSYTITNDQGTVVYSKDQLAANTIYKDTVDLPNGCFEFRLLDAGEDGLSWWANSAAGIGYLKFAKMIGGAAFRNYNPDFGGEIRESFTTGHVMSVDELPSVSFMEVYPNPATSEFNVDVSGNSDRHALIRIMSADGRLVREQNADLSLSSIHTFDLSGESAGIYFVNVITSSGTYMKKIILSKQ